MKKIKYGKIIQKSSPLKRGYYLWIKREKRKEIITEYIRSVMMFDGTHMIVLKRSIDGIKFDDTREKYNKVDFNEEREDTSPSQWKLIYYKNKESMILDNMELL